MSERTVLWAEALGHWVLAWTLVVLAVVLWILVRRPRRSTIRYGGWLLATFAGAALLPIVVVVGPRVSWSEVVDLVRRAPAVPDRSDSPSAFRSWFDDQPISFRQESVTAREERLAARAESVLLDDRTEPPSSRVDPPQTPVVDRWLMIAVGIWGAGFLIFAARLLWSAWRIRSLLAGLEPTAPEGLETELESVRRALSIGRRVRVGTHPEIAAPLCVGLLRPVILWPTQENCPMSPSERLASLTHELAHLHHGDDRVALLAEIWRSLTWFYPPVHLAVACLRREREYRCDDVAAAKLDTPEHHAQWLLDLAPVRVSPPLPLLAASLLGGTSLADRVRRIVRGELKWAQPVGRRRWAMLALLAFLILGAAGSVRLIGFAGRAVADEPAGARLPELTSKDLAAKIREAMKPYDDNGLIRVVFSQTRDMNWKFGNNQGNAEEQKPILVSFRGRARYESDGSRWRAEYDSMMPSSGSTRLSIDRWSSGFDGVERYDRQISHNQVILGETNSGAREWTPRSLIWKKSDELIRFLEEPDRDKFPIAIEQRVVDGSRCYLVKVGKHGAEWESEYSISPKQGYLPISSAQFRNGKKYAFYDLHGVRAVAPGIWAPERIEDESLSIGNDGASRLSHRRRIQVVSYQPRLVIPPDVFSFAIPYGVDVVDRRLGYAYHKDPWWPEAGAMLREKFGWPKPDLSPLRNLGTPTDKKIDGQPASPLRVVKWLNSQPLELAALRGKVVLLEFWNISTSFYRELVPALRQIYATYHPAGLEMIAIHTPADQPEEVRRYVREFGIEYPVAIDAPGRGPCGATAEAYGSRDRTCAFLIDPEGKVHSVGSDAINGGRIVETLIPLLRKAGAGDVKPISLETPRLPDDAYKALELMFQSKAKEALDADPPGRITGRIVDGHGQPKAGATVRATLQLTVLSLSSPGADRITAYRGPVERFTAEAGPDGWFELSSLCKGEYSIKAEAPGKAWAERKFVIATDFISAPLEIVLDQGGEFSGQVRDEEGQPVAGATITLTERHHYEQGEFRYVTSFDSTWPDPVTTDATGQFRFTGVREGRYTIEVKAAGFRDGKVEKIPAGTENVAVKLKRSR
jgi:beta-lactamase regulating signal transducer with metallopeptidase domain